MSKQLRSSSFAAPASSSTAVSRDLLSALLGTKATAHCLERMVALEPSRTLAPACKISVMVPVHIGRALQSWSSSYPPPPPRYQNLCLPLSQLPSLSFMVLLRNTLLLQSFSTRSVWQSVGVKPGLYQSTVLKSYLIKCYGNDFFFQRCGRFAIFPKHTYDLHEKQYYRKGIVLYLSILWAKTESQAMGDAWEACIMSPHEPMVSKKDGEINQFKSYIYLYWTYNHNTLKHVCVAYINIVAGTWEMLRLCCLFLVPDRKLVVCWSK